MRARMAETCTVSLEGFQLFLAPFPAGAARESASRFLRIAKGTPLNTAARTVERTVGSAEMRFHLGYLVVSASQE